MSQEFGGVEEECLDDRRGSQPKRKAQSCRTRERLLDRAGLNRLDHDGSRLAKIGRRGKYGHPHRERQRRRLSATAVRLSVSALEPWTLNVTTLNLMASLSLEEALEIEVIADKYR
jgi:hypothetical protein